MNLSRQYGIINLQLIFVQPIVDNKSYFGNIDDVLEILGYFGLYVKFPMFLPDFNRI